MVITHLLHFISEKFLHFLIKNNVMFRLVSSYFFSKYVFILLISWLVTLTTSFTIEVGWFLRLVSKFFYFQIIFKLFSNKFRTNLEHVFFKSFQLFLILFHFSNPNFIFILWFSAENMGSINLLPMLLVVTPQLYYIVIYYMIKLSK